MQMWQIVANLEFVTGFAIDLQTRKPNISPRELEAYPIKIQGTLQVEYTIPSILDFNYVVPIVLQCQNRYICNKYSWQKAPMLVLHQKEKQDNVENVLSLC